MSYSILGVNLILGHVTSSQLSHLNTLIRLAHIFSALLAQCKTGAINYYFGLSAVSSRATPLETYIASHKDRSLPQIHVTARILLLSAL